jgi:hypothetical protein
MNNDIRNAMKVLYAIVTLISLAILPVSGQPSQGTLKIFSDKPLVVYVDEVHCPQYDEIKLVPGTHYVKAINSDGVRVYSEIVSVKANEVTSLLIEAPQAQVPVSQPGVVYGQPSSDPQAGMPSEKSDPLPAAPPKPVQTIDIGQTAGILPADMGGAFGVTFGMNIRDVDRIMSAKSARVQRNSGYNAYAISYGSSVYVVECRFIDQKLFQIIVGYTPTYTDNSKLKLDKKEVPFPEFNRMLNDVTAIYGEPTTSDKIFLGGYTEDDGRILEALKRKKALILHTWIDPGTGNNVMVGLAYTTAPLAGVIYTSGPLGAEAKARRLRLHGYDYSKSFNDNYFSN